jgi:hypothetical protein
MISPGLIIGFAALDALIFVQGICALRHYHHEHH